MQAESKIRTVAAEMQNIAVFLFITFGQIKVKLELVM